MKELVFIINKKKMNFELITAVCLSAYVCIQRCTCTIPQKSRKTMFKIILSIIQKQSSTHFLPFRRLKKNNMFLATST